MNRTTSNKKLQSRFGLEMIGAHGLLGTQRTPYSLEHERTKSSHFHLPEAVLPLTAGR